MAYCGMQIPAAGGRGSGASRASLPISATSSRSPRTRPRFRRICGRMREIIAQAGERSLVLVDEIGGGTEPSSGAALAVAMLERLLACPRLRHRHHACDRTQTLRASDAGRRERQRALRPANLRADLPTGCRNARTIAGVSAGARARHTAGDHRSRRVAARYARTRLRKRAGGASAINARAANASAKRSRANARTSIVFRRTCARVPKRSTGNGGNSPTSPKSRMQEALREFAADSHGARRASNRSSRR